MQRTTSTISCLSCRKPHMDVVVYDQFGAVEEGKFGANMYYICPETQEQVSFGAREKRGGDADPIYVAYGELHLALNELMEEKGQGLRSDKARYLSVAMTDLEKLIAFIKAYLLDQ